MLRNTTLSFLLCLFMLSPTLGQSPLSGLITSNTTLTKANSPYAVSDHLVISSGVTLTIEPGVELRFADAKKLEVRGTLTALGNATDSIAFTSLSGTAPDSWIGITVLNNLGARADFAYGKFLYAMTGIRESCCGAGRVTVKHSRFSFNTTAMGGYSGAAATVDYCKFTGNTYTITEADKRIDHSEFANNRYGLFSTERVSVYNSTFRAHEQVALYGGRGTVSNCVITGNSTGVKAFFEGFTIVNTTITDNGKGVITGSYNASTAAITGSRICNNTTYNVEHLSDGDMSLAGNCFCTSDQAAIEAKLLDGDDNSQAGRLNYTIYDSDCATVLQQVDKTSPRTITLRKADSPYAFNNDLIVRANETMVVEPGVELQFAAHAKLEVRGVLTALGQNGDSITFTVQPGAVPFANAWQGIVLRNDLGAKASFAYSRFSRAYTGIYESCCGAGKAIVNHSRFYDNTTAMGGYAGNSSTADYCVFENNTYTITSADKKIDHSLFSGNQYGLYQTERVSVSNSTFEAHTRVALHGGRGTVSNCIITGNEVGIQAFFEGFAIKNSNISDNGKGIITGSYDAYTAPITDSRICNNATYNIEHGSSGDFTVAGNCFCTSDSTAIEDKILDGYDIAQKGLVNYSIYTNDCAGLLRQVDKTQPRTIHLVKANSPYTFTNDLVIRANETLIVDPGVEVRFASQKVLEIRGKMTAIGTTADSITFVSLSGTSPSSWQGINVRTDQGAQADFAYARFLYASAAIYESCCYQGKTTVMHSRFSGNTTAMGGYAGTKATVDHCKFTGNLYAVTQADKLIDHSVFSNNSYGLYMTERISVSNSSFTNHSAAALMGGRGTVSNCTVTGNAVGIKAFFEGFTVKSSDISGNGKGIITGSYDNFTSPLTDNKICDNTTFNIEHSSVSNFNVESNCFCTTDSTAIENKIHDGYDNASVGLVEYSVYNTGCSEVFYRVIADGKVKQRVGPHLIIQSYKASSRVTEDRGFRLSTSAIVIPGSTLIDTVRYSIVIKPGNDYTVNGDFVTPASNYNGTLRIPIQYSDGFATSDEYIHEVTVTPVNDAPVVSKYDGSTSFSWQGTLEVLPSDFTITDPDDRYPEDFTLSVDARPYYRTTGTTINFTGIGHGDVEIPIVISDGEASVLYTIIAQTNLITGIDDEAASTAPYPNPFSDRIVLVSGMPRQIFTTTGQVMKLTVNAGGEIETSHLPAGIYVLQASVDGRDQFYRMVKK